MAKKEKNNWRIRLQNAITKKNVLAAVVGIILVVQFIQVQYLFDQSDFLEGRDSSLVGEIGQVKSAYFEMGKGLNDIKEFLRLPTDNYLEFEEVEDPISEDENTDEIQLAFFKYVSHLAESRRIEADMAKGEKLLLSLVQNEELNTFLEEEGVKLSPINREDEELNVQLFTGSEVIASYVLSKADAGLSFVSDFASRPVFLGEFEDLEKGLRDFVLNDKDKFLALKKEIEERAAELWELVAKAEIQAALANKSMRIASDEVEGFESLSYEIFNRADEVIGSIEIEKKKNGNFVLIDVNNKDLWVETKDIDVALLPFLKDLDADTYTERKVKAALESLKKTVSDGGFLAILEQNNLSVSEELREDDSRYYFDIFDEKGDAISSIVLEKATAVVNIAEPNGANSENLLFFDAGFSKKKL